MNRTGASRCRTPGAGRQPSLSPAGHQRRPRLSRSHRHGQTTRPHRRPRPRDHHPRRRALSQHRTTGRLLPIPHRLPAHPGHPAGLKSTRRLAAAGLICYRRLTKTGPDRPVGFPAEVCVTMRAARAGLKIEFNVAARCRNLTTVNTPHRVRSARNWWLCSSPTPDSFTSAHENIRQGDCG